VVVPTKFIVSADVTFKLVNAAVAKFNSLGTAVVIVAVVALGAVNLAPSPSVPFAVTVIDVARATSMFESHLERTVPPTSTPASTFKVAELAYAAVTVVAVPSTKVFELIVKGPVDAPNVKVLVGAEALLVVVRTVEAFDKLTVVEPV